MPKVGRNKEETVEIRFQSRRLAASEEGKLYKWILEQNLDLNSLIVSLLEARFRPLLLPSVESKSDEQWRVIEAIYQIESWIRAILIHHKIDDPRAIKNSDNKEARDLRDSSNTTNGSVDSLRGLI